MWKARISNPGERHLTGSHLKPRIKGAIKVKPNPVGKEDLNREKVTGQIGARGPNKDCQKTYQVS